MPTLNLSRQIQAPVSVVYRMMLDKPTYEQWAAAFEPSSTVEGTWEAGTKMYFTSKDQEGKRYGMVSEVMEHIPGKIVSLLHRGILDGDQEITEGPKVAPWVNLREIYRFTGQNGLTTVSIEQDIPDTYKAFFESAWEQALDKLKSLCEAKSGQ